MEHTLNIDAILARHLADELLTNEERQALQAYIADNGDEYRQLVNTMSRLDKERRTIDVDMAAAWKKVEQQLIEDVRPALTFRLRPLLMIAASLLLLVGVGLYSYLMRPDELMLANITQQPETYRLPDGSKLLLYPHATLTYRASESKAERKAELQGKAFFDVVHNGQTFTVEAGKLRVDVLGTSFDVDATLAGREQVKVVTGRVLVATDNQQTVLTRGQRVKLNNGHLEKTSGMGDSRKAVFTFKDTPIRKAIRKIEHAMDIKIELAPGLDDNNRITTQINGAEPSEMVRELSMLCNCRYDSVSPIHYRLHP